MTENETEEIENNKNDDESPSHNTSEMVQIWNMIQQ